MRIRHAAAAAALLALAACSSGGGDKDAAPPAATTPPATTAPAATTTAAAGTAIPAAHPPAYRVYRDSPGGSDGIGLADLLLPGASKADARAAIADFVRNQQEKGDVAYVVHVVLDKVPDGKFLCQGQWRKDAATAASLGGSAGLNITCP